MAGTGKQKPSIVLSLRSKRVISLSAREDSAWHEAKAKRNAQVLILQNSLSSLGLISSVQILYEPILWQLLQLPLLHVPGCRWNPHCTALAVFFSVMPHPTWRQEPCEIHSSSASSENINVSFRGLEMEKKIKSWRYFYCCCSQDNLRLKMQGFCGYLWIFVERGNIFPETNIYIWGKNKITFLCLKTITSPYKAL